MNELNIKKYKGYFFDLDNTLINSVELWKNLDYELLKTLTPNVSENFHAEKVNFLNSCNDENLYVALCGFYIERYDLKNITKERLREMQLEIATLKLRQIEYISGADTLLNLLKNDDKKILLVTLSDRHCVNILKDENENIKAAADFNLIFDHIIPSDDVENRKPSGDCYRLALEKAGLKKEDCLIFEDSLTGVLAANDADIDVCCIYHPDNENDIDVLKKKSTYFFSSFEDLLKSI